MESIDIAALPWEIKEKLFQLQLELSEGDITSKGFEKKKGQLLQPFLPKEQRENRSRPSPSTRASRRHGRRVTRDENRYHSEIRAEAVQQALANYGKDGSGRGKRDVPLPVRRPTQIADTRRKHGAKRQDTFTESSSEDDDSLFNETGGDSSGSRRSGAGPASGGGQGPKRGSRRKHNNISSHSETPNSSRPNSQVTPLVQNGKPTSARDKPTPELSDPVKLLRQPHKHSPSPTRGSGQSNRSSRDSTNMNNSPNNKFTVPPSTQTPQQPQRSPPHPPVIPIPPPPDVVAPSPAATQNAKQQREGSSKSNAMILNMQNMQLNDQQNRRSTSNGLEQNVVSPHKRRSSKEHRESKSSNQQVRPSSNMANVLLLTSGVVGSGGDGSIFQTPTQTTIVDNNPLEQLYENTRMSNEKQINDYQNAVIRPPKVSTKIQQLLHTLQRPKKKPLAEFYNDDDAELEAMAKVVDPTAPKPEGAIISPTRGESFRLPTNVPSSMEAALQRWGSACHRTPVATVLDQNGKQCPPLLYGKLLSRAQKVAYLLLNKLGRSANQTEGGVKAGDRIALVYPNNEPHSFMVALHGCLLAGVVPVPIEVPLSKRDAGLQQVGFLLGGCTVQYALTSEACLKGLPKGASGDVVDFKGWPRLTWCVTEHLGKVPKEWMPPPQLNDDSLAYIEYTTDKEGSVKGVTVTRESMLAHTRALTAACEYQESEIMVCVLDFKREMGLWHSMLASVYNGMQVIFIPYSLMKVNPASWMMMITKHRASVGCVRSRDLHWGLLASRDHKDINLASLRMLLVADGANPWSLSSCDQFAQVFSKKGLKCEVLCPTAGSSETQTVSLRRPGRTGFGSSGRGILSMSALSYGVVRVDQENSLTSLTLQDAGQVLSGATAVVVKMSGTPQLCKADEIGEICLHAHSTANGYFGLAGMSTQTFQVDPLAADSRPLGVVHYVRSGLMGFLGPGGLVFVCGTRQGLMMVSGRQHSADDVIATVLAVEPMKFIYRGRIAVFSVGVLRDERIVIAAEQKSDVSEEESFNWMSRVLQAIDSIHSIGIYCLALVPANHLPKTALGGIHISETRQRFLDGALHPTNLLMCPHTCVTNLPKPREMQPDVGPAAMYVGNIVQGVRISGAVGRDLGPLEHDRFQYLGEVLKFRAQQSPDHQLFTLINSKGIETVSLTCLALHKKAEKIAALLIERAHLNAGDHVALIFPPGTDLICAFYGCLYVGMVPVCVRPPHPQNVQTTLPTVRMIVEVSKAIAILSSSPVVKLLKSKEATGRIDIKAWPTIVDVDDTPRKKLASSYKPPSPDNVCYLDFSVSTTGMLAGIKVTYNGASSLCRSLKLTCELYPSRHVTLCLDPYCGLGFALWCLSSVFSGHHSILIPPSEVELNPPLWLQTVSQQKVRDTFCSYGIIELCYRELAQQLPQLEEKNVNLSCVRNCVVVAEERPRIQLCQAFTKIFAKLGFPARALSTSFGCRANIALCMQGSHSPDPTTLYCDARALRNDRVTLVEKGAPHSVPMMESGKILPGVKVVIANPDTKGQCADSHLGEIWVSSTHNASGFFTSSMSGNDALSTVYEDTFHARLSTGDTRSTFARTGYLGFLRQTQSVTEDGGLHDAVFVVGAIDETMMLRGMRYHPVDIEQSVLRAHKKICECAVFTWTNLLVVVAELAGPENEALDLVPLVTSVVLEDHHLIVGVVVICDPGTVPINSRGEKQRMHLRDAFLHDQLDPIYVAYNM